MSMLLLGLLAGAIALGLIASPFLYAARVARAQKRTQQRADTQAKPPNLD